MINHSQVNGFKNSSVVLIFIFYDNWIRLVLPSSFYSLNNFNNRFHIMLKGKQRYNSQKIPPGKGSKQSRIKRYMTITSYNVQHYVNFFCTIPEGIKLCNIWWWQYFLFIMCWWILWPRYSSPSTYAIIVFPKNIA